ncbi:hypothetical protein [Streptomyces sp. NPDC049915]|uniref:hypothetical protein n=1 Tax=Streptomyces sp. NPDC049915 TaxID=3155510 RepID=UPI0034355B88
MSARPAEARDALAALTGTGPKQAGGVDPQTMVVLYGAQGTYRLPVAEDGEELQGAWFARAILDKKTADQAAKDDTCPACNTDNGISFLGTALAALASATVTQLFTGAPRPAWSGTWRSCAGCWSDCGCAAVSGTGGWTPESGKRASTST